MAEVPVLVPIGNGITAGHKARLSDVSAADLERWYGPAASSLTDWPLSAPMPGVRSWLHKLPYATTEERNITAETSTTITIDGTPLVSPTDVGTWVFVATNATGQGQYRRITAIAGATLQVHAVLNPLLTDEGTGFGKLKIIRDSHRIAAGSSLLVIAKHPDTPAFTSAVLGKTVLFLGAYDGNIEQLERRVTAWTSSTITLDRPLLGGADALQVDSGFVILTGANAVQDLVSVTAGAALVPFGLHVDDAPVFSTGHDRCFTGDMGTAFASPLAELGVKLTVQSADDGTGVIIVTRPAFEDDDVGALIKVGSQTYTIDTVTSATEIKTAEVLSPEPAAGDRLILVRLKVNFVAQLAWRMRQRFAAPMVVLELGSVGARILPHATPPEPPFSWARSLTSNDFCPSSDASHYKVLEAAMQSCQALIEAEGNTAKFYVLVNCADHDAQVPDYTSIGANMRVLRDALRADLSDPTMPFIMAGPSTYGSTPTDLRPAIYEQLAALKAADAWTSYVDTRDGIAKAPDGLNLHADGQIALANRFADTLIEVLDLNGGVASEAVSASPADIVALIDAALAQGLDVLSYTVNGRQVTLHSLTELLSARKYYASLVSRQGGLRRTVASFGGRP